MKKIKTIILGTILSLNVLATSSQKDSIVLYNNYSQINSTGVFKDGEVLFKDIPREIKKESIVFSNAVDEYNFSSKTLNMRDIQLDNLGEYVRIKKEDAGIYSTDSWKARLIGVGSKLMVRDRDGYIYQLGDKAGVYYPKFKRELKPSITAKSKNYKDGKKINLSYLTNGISWNSKHIIKMTENNKIHLSTYVVLKNKTNRLINQAKATLIAGESETETKNYKFMVREARISGMDSMPRGESMSGFYKFKMPKLLTLKGNEEKTIPLYKGRSLSSELVNNFNFSLASNNINKPIHSSQTLKFKNTAHPKSLILPKGVVNIYNEDKNELIFIGSKRIGNIGKNEEVELSIGKNIDVYLKTKTELLSIKKVNKAFEKTKKATFTFYNESKKESHVRLMVSIPWSAKSISTFKTDMDLKTNQTRLNNMVDVTLTIPGSTTIQGTMSYKEVK